MIAGADIDDRIVKCQKILDQDPNSQIFAALAEAFRKKGELDRAFRVCQNGLKIHPSYGSAHVVMAKVNLDRQLYDWAEAELKKATELDGNSRAVELLLAEIYIYKGEFNRAITLLKRLHQSDQSNSQIKKLLDIAMRLPEERAVYAEQNKRPGERAAEEEPEAVQEESTEPEVGLTAPEIIAEAMKIPELQGGIFLNPEGLVVESQWSIDLDAAVCAATFAEQHRALNQDLVQASFGTAHGMLIENSDHVFYLVTVENGMFLLVAGPGLNLGGFRMKMVGVMQKYQAE